MAPQFATQAPSELDDDDYDVPPPPLPKTPPPTTPTATPLQKSLSGDLLRPVLSMPPVVLMGGVGAGANNNRDSFISYTASPIVEEPPSPAPGGLEYPDFRNRNQQLDYDAYTVDEDEDGGGETYDQIIEVRARWLRLNMLRNRLSFFFFVCNRALPRCDRMRFFPFV